MFCRNWSVSPEFFIKPNSYVHHAKFCNLFKLCATKGTARTLERNGIKCKKINKVTEGSPHIVNILNAKKIDLVINTSDGKHVDSIKDSTSLRRSALINKVPYCTTMSFAFACIEGIKSLKSKKINVRAIQELGD